MKVVILAGGFGTRISEESHLRPKPMIEIGSKPILWHIMKIYSHYGFNDFIICLGYKGYFIKEYFAHYFLHESDVTFDFTHHERQIIHQNLAEPWKVTLVNTGMDTATGGRLKRVKGHIGEEPFMLTYGDGIGAINIQDLVAFHSRHGRLATVTSVQLAGRFGALGILEGGKVSEFSEKPQGDGAWISAGFFVLSPRVLDYIPGDATPWEREPLARLADEGQLHAFQHRGFWHPMDTLRDYQALESLWAQGKAPWKVWAD